MIPAVFLMTLLAGPAVAADKVEAESDATKARMAGKTLVESATTAAVRDAIESVLVENRMELEILFNGRKSLTVAEGP